ncbi:23S rRNA (adenine(1618)-N(6))-methyltransferase RlmF [Litoribrevibacter euphylliae]|uniref:Ribosomal RNA large subunit methyltransferase F n=1 Tax=Litoribrevibacter euphylliae TaxID=1834034 RepID=A0ABV7HCI6_9GAMM
MSKHSKHKTSSQPKAALHPRNPHSGRYDLNALCQVKPELKNYLKLNPRGEQTVDFGDDQAVKCLNAALLKHHYHIEFWDIPKGYLCPPIPGRADYIHHLADLLSESNQGNLPTGKHIHGLDIGTGANVIYPLLAHKSYGWKMTASDIEKPSLASAEAILKANQLHKSIKLKHQANKAHIFEGVISDTDRFHFTLCNPPFHTSAQEAADGTDRKLRNLKKSAIKQQDQKPSTRLNFGGQHNELWCEGGEVGFIKQMIRESVQFQNQCLWFTSLVAKKEHLPAIHRALKKHKVAYFREVKMAQGNKISRFIAWTFHPKSEQIHWFRDH